MIGQLRCRWVSYIWTETYFPAEPKLDTREDTFVLRRRFPNLDCEIVEGESSSYEDWTGKCVKMFLVGTVFMYCSHTVMYLLQV